MKLLTKYMEQAERLVQEDKLHEAGACIRKIIRLEEKLGSSQIINKPRFKKLLRDLARRGVEKNK
jgi:flagellar biosynthesis regulator FlbT